MICPICAIENIFLTNVLSRRYQGHLNRVGGRSGHRKEVGNIPGLGDNILYYTIISFNSISLSTLSQLKNPPNSNQNG